MMIERTKTETGLARFLTLRDRLRGLSPRGIDMRSYWRGRSFAESEGQPMTIRRARALEAVLSQMHLVIRDEDLIVGAPVGVLADGLPCGVSDADYTRYTELDRAIGERTFLTHADHIAIDHTHLLQVGLRGLLHEVRCARAEQDDPDKRIFLESVHIALMAAVHWARRWAAACRSASRRLDVSNAERGRELQNMADDLELIARQAPGSLAQALQLVWLVHVILFVEGRGSIAFGRMDQYLLPFYERSLAEGEPHLAENLLACLWAKLEEPLIPNPIQNICISGQTSQGEDATNALSCLVLDITRQMQVPNGNLSARLHRDTPEWFYERCAGVIKTGVGFPAVFNDEVLIPALRRMGIPLDVARDYAFVGCIETFLPGKMPPWSDSRVNLPSAVDRVLRDGLDGACRGLRSGAPSSLATFDDFLAAFREQVVHLVQDHCARINARQAEPAAAEFTSPFLSAFVADCIARGQDINDGGTLFPELHGPCGMGLGTTADALAAIRQVIYQDRDVSWSELLAALDADFVGYEALRQRLRAAPKYGNDDPRADGLAAQIVAAFSKAVLEQRTAHGGRHVPLMAANTANIAAGRELGATADGRHARQPLSDAASPTFGQDRHGPTAFLNSTSSVDYEPVVGGSVVNIRFSPETLAGDRGTAVLVALIKTYFRRGGVQLQLNVTGRRLLEQARRHPELHRSLVVRVSGFSALYVTLDDAVQCDILARTEH